ncbi:MAG: hypothetical protein KI791_09350 [Cyclobacteriaceae bacterium]|nr:hypothetical protein [Cyclobacteriaceae bacterium SS2]
MKNYILILFAIIAFSSCDEFVNSAVESEVTYLAKIEVAGERTLNLDCNPSGGFDDPGATAIESGAEIPIETSIHGTYFLASEIDGPDLFSVNYSAVNIDGIPGVASRRIYWPACNGDLVSSIAGMYSVSVLRNGTNTPAYEDNGPFFIRDIGDGKYQLSDAIGGWYDFGRALGPDFAAPGMVITANNIATNDFTFGPKVEVGYFGGDVEMLEFKVDATKKQITWECYWDFDYTFEVTLTQVDPSEFNL